MDTPDWLTTIYVVVEQDESDLRRVSCMELAVARVCEENGDGSLDC